MVDLIDCVGLSTCKCSDVERCAVYRQSDRDRVIGVSASLMNRVGYLFIGIKLSTRISGVEGRGKSECEVEFQDKCSKSVMSENLVRVKEISPQMLAYLSLFNYTHNNNVA